MYCYAQSVLNNNRVIFFFINSSRYPKFALIKFILEMDTVNANPNGKDVSLAPTTETTFNGIEWPDYVVIALYFVSVLAVGLYVSINV